MAADNYMGGGRRASVRAGEKCETEAGMICAGERIKHPDACASSTTLDDLVRKTVDYELKGELGEVVIRDDGDGLFNACDRIGITEEDIEGEAGREYGDGGDAVRERLGAMGIKEFPPYNAPLKALASYVNNMREAKITAGGTNLSAAHDVEMKLVAARKAAAEAKIAFDEDLEADIRRLCGESPHKKEYDLLTSLSHLCHFPYYDEGRNDAEGELGRAKEIAAKAGISIEKVEKDALRARWELANQRLISALGQSSDGNLDETRRLLNEALSFADMGDFEEDFKGVLKEEYEGLTSVEALAGSSFIDVERALDTAAVIAGVIGVPTERVVTEAQNARHALCNMHYVSAMEKAIEGDMKAARAYLTLAENIADMGGFEDDFVKMKGDFQRVLGRSQPKEPKAEASDGVLTSILHKIESALRRSEEDLDGDANAKEAGLRPEPK